MTSQNKTKQNKKEQYKTKKKENKKQKQKTKSKNPWVFRGPYPGPQWTNSCQIWCVRIFHYVLLKCGDENAEIQKKNIWWRHTSVLYTRYRPLRAKTVYVHSDLPWQKRVTDILIISSQWKPCIVIGIYLKIIYTYMVLALRGRYYAQVVTWGFKALFCL